MSPTLSVPPTVKLLVILTLLFGTIIDPVPAALNSKSAFVLVVVIKLSSTSISSNWNAPLTSKSPVTVKFPLIVELPVCVEFPICVTVPVIFVLL
jgi:hypothetical protein